MANMVKNLIGKLKGRPTAGGKKGLIFGLITSLLVVLILTLAVIGVGIYRYQWQGSVIQKVVKIFPYPIARINWHFLSYADYLKEIGVLTNFYNKQATANGAAAASAAEIRQKVMDRVVRNEFFRQLARKYKITVTDVDVGVAWQSMIKSSGSSETEINKMVQDLYGWSPEEFKVKIVRPSLIEEKVREQLTQAADYDKESYAKAEEVLQSVKAGQEDFGELAKKYSEDTYSAQVFGDLGWFGRGVMVKEFEDAVFGLTVGQVSELVKTSYGYHIIKLIDKRKNEAGAEEVKASHILIKSRDFEIYYQELLKQAAIKKYIKI